MPTVYFAGFDVVTRDASGVTSPLASESIRVKVVGGSVLPESPLTANAEGFVAPVALTSTVGAELEFYSATKTGVLRQFAAATQAEAYSTQVTLVLDDDFVTTKTSQFAEIYLKDNNEPTVPFVHLGTQAKGTTAKYVFESAFTKDIDVIALSRTTEYEFATPLPTAPADNVAPESTRPADEIEVGTTGILSGTNNRVFYQASGLLAQSGNLTFNGNSFAVATSSASAVPLTVTGASSQTADYFNVKKSTGAILFSVKEDSVGGVMNLHANNGVIIGFYRINSGGGSSGLDLAGFNQLTLVNQGSTTANLVLRSRGSSDGVIGIDWQTYSGQTFNFFGYGGSGGEVIWKDESAETVHIYHDRTSANRGLWIIGGKLDLADGVNIELDTTTGTKIGTSTSQKLGFFNATPVTRRTITGVTTQEQIDSIVDALDALGLVTDAR